jgi:hypothetical protein
MSAFLRHEKDVLQELLLEFDCGGAGSTASDKNIDTDRGHDEDFAAASGSKVCIWSRPQDTWNSGGDPSGLRIQEVPQESFYTICLSPLLHGSDPAVGGRD